MYLESGRDVLLIFFTTKYGKKIYNMIKYEQICTGNEVTFLARYKKDMKKIYFRRRALFLIILFLFVFIIIKTVSFIIDLIGTNTQEVSSYNNINKESNVVTSNELKNNISNTIDTNENNPKVLDDWRIRLANSDNILPDDFSVELADIDEIRQFDARAIDELNDMVNDMRKEGISNIWVQSAYRSVAKQKELYNNSITKYLKQR